jgi:hypothetical protein
MLLPKIGAVPAHPANVQRLLHDEDELVLVFPEGAKGTTKLYKDRYKLRRFGPRRLRRGGDAGGRADRPDRARRRGGEPARVHAARPPAPAHGPHLHAADARPFPLFGPLGRLAYLPAKFTIRFLPPVPTDAMGDRPWEDKALVQTIANDIRYTIQEALFDMVGKRRSVWLG